MTDVRSGARSRRRWPLLAVLAGTLLITGCGSDLPLNTLDPAGSKAEDIDNLISPIFILAGVVFVIIQGAVLVAWWRFRVPKPKEGEHVYPGGYADEEFPEQVDGHFAAEITWTVVPFLLLAVITIFSVAAILKLDDVEAAPPGAKYPNMQVTVVGQQWWWEYQYHLDGNTDTPPDIVTANELVIPVGQDVRIFTTSRDVIHSFWIPRLNGKKDAVPGRVHPWVIQANEVGRFAGQCTEFCGLSHAYMRMFTVALSEDDFGTWVDNQTVGREPLDETDPNYDGEQLFIQNCARCHIVNGVTERDLNGDGELEADTLALYGTIEDYRDLTDDTGSQGKYTGDANLTAGAAPNLTHFATRSSFAGSFFELYPDAQEASEAGEYLNLSGGPYFRSTLEAWLRDPGAVKPNAQPEQNRGMPNLGLTELEIDSLTDYLLSLD
ncbi:MAG: cytochrome c oxidase subunit II [Acidimicrobiales bacterium]